MKKELIAKWPVEIGIIAHTIVISAFVLSGVNTWLLTLIIIAILIYHF